MRADRADHSDLTDRIIWRKAGRSADTGGNCVEVALSSAGGAIRDSKAPDQGVLALSPGQALSFLTAVKTGRFRARR